MTANEMRNVCIQLYTGATPIEMAYNNSEWSRFLTLAVRQYVKTRMFENRNTAAEGLGAGSRREIELTELKRYKEFNTIDASIGEYKNSVIFDLPDDYMYNLQEQVDITVGSVAYTGVSVLPMSNDNFNEHLQSPFNKPNHRIVWRMYKSDPTFIDGTVEDGTTIRSLIVTDNNTIVNKYRCWYIGQHPDIVVDTRTPANQKHCILYPETHDEICRIAVRMALGAIGNEKYTLAHNESAIDN